jgi:hypothetical protein
MRLHELTDAGLQILELLETGNADYSKALSDINTEFNDKVLDCGMVYRNIQVEAEVYKTESKRLADKANSLEKRAEGLRVYVEQQMEQLGIDSIKGSTFTVKFRKLPPLVQIDNLDAIPASYKRIVPLKVEPDKVKLLEDMTSGIKVEGASLKTDRRKLEIK